MLTCGGPYVAMATIVARFYITVINTITKSNLGEETVYLAYVSQICLLRETKARPVLRNQSRSHGGVLLTGLLLVACSAFLRVPKTAPCRVDPPFSILNHRLAYRLFL